MSPYAERIVEHLRDAEEALARDVEAQQRRWHYRVRQGRHWFDHQRRQAHRRLKQSIPAYLWGANIWSVLTAPVIYSLIVPLAALDVWVTIYQWICFPIYGIPHVPRRAYCALDRQKLAYLNAIEKTNCVLCGYANGMIAYVREVAARTEQYWCPIKHATAVPAPHDRYHLFVDYGDAEGYRRELQALRLALRSNPAHRHLGHRTVEARHSPGIERRRTAPAGRRHFSYEAWRRALLVCGAASSVLYALMIWRIRYDGYDPFSQVPSELTAIGAPTRALWARLGWMYTVLVAAFGIGVWKSAGGHRAVRTVGGLILAYASLGLLWPFAAMHQREVLAAGGGTLSDTLHVVLGAVTVLLMFVAIGCGASAFGTPFRLYSIATIVVLLTFGGLTFIEAPRLQANQPTPWIGLWERINISVFLLWIVILGAVLWRTRSPKRRTHLER
jgi:hypothetical protein